MILHLIDGTYELFRSYYGAPSARTSENREVGAVRGLLRSLAALLREEGTSHVACAFDREIESFRNQMFDGYKTGEGIEPDLFNQFELAERAVHALGVVVWPMVEFEADDALASAAQRWHDHPEISQIRICTPDKDLAQCVVEDRVVLHDRRRQKVLDARAVQDKYGVAPESIPDWLGLVGDTADGIPGIPRWGAKSAAAVLSHYRFLEQIPRDASQWEVKVRGAASLVSNLVEQEDQARLYKELATLRRDVPLQEELDDLRWRGARQEALAGVCEDLEDSRFLERIALWRDDKEREGHAP